MAFQVNITNGNNINGMEPLENTNSVENVSKVKKTQIDKLKNDVNSPLNGNADGPSKNVNGLDSIKNNVSNGNGVDVEEKDVNFIPNVELVSDDMKNKPVKNVKDVNSKETPSTSVSSPELPKEDVDDKIAEDKSISDSNDKEDDNSSIDIVGETEEEIIPSIEFQNDEISEEEEEVEVKNKYDNGFRNVHGSATMFSRFYDKLYPKKKVMVSSSSNLGTDRFYFENKGSERSSRRGISGRRAVHNDSSFDISDSNISRYCSLKRKNESDSFEVPNKKFASSSSEVSPGWTFFSSPFSKFWTPSKTQNDVTVSSSTPLRALHEDIEINDSLLVNVDESMNVYLQKDLETDLNFQNVYDEKKSVLNSEKSEVKWKCNVM